MKFTCTFTGIDSAVIKDKMPVVVHLSEKYPFIEWGVLFSMTRAGQDPKYPTVDEIKYFSDYLYNAAYKDNIHTNRAIHLCGSAARKFLTIESAKDSMVLHDLVGRFGRTQININAKEHSFEIKPTVLRQLAIFYRPIIFQYNANNKEMLDSFELAKYPNVHILKDASGGNGIFSSDTTIPEICNQSTIGFAGGFGPDNIEIIFPNIYQSVMSNNVEGQFENSHFWIDMETKVRDETNQMDLDKVAKIAEYLDAFLKDKSVEF